MTDHSFSKFVPGFEFLQGLVKNAGAALPGFNQWVAPTINPQELEKRIEELRTVQFWLEQNARMLAATIQALEVQRMTLSTLHAMNVPMADLSSVLKTPTAPVWPPTPPEPPAAPAPKAADPSSTQARASATEGADATGASEQTKSSTASAVDPMQWWTALTQQFTQLAANAMKDPATDAAQMAASTMMKQGFDVVGETLRKAAGATGVTGATSTPPKAAAKSSTRSAAKTAPKAKPKPPPKAAGKTSPTAADKPGRSPSRSTRRPA